MRDNILKDVYANDKVELSSIDVNLGAVDEINTASQLIQKQYDSVFQKAMLASSNINEGVKLGNKAFSDAQKFYQQGVKIEQQAKDLGIPIPADFKKSMDILYKFSQLEGQQIVKDLNQAQKILG